MRHAKLACYTLLICALWQLPAQAKAKFASFDPPGSVYTYAAAINAKGDITGSYDINDGPSQGFLRSAAGAFTTFDVPGDTYGASPEAIDATGTVAGFDVDSDQINHDFVGKPRPGIERTRLIWYNMQVLR